MPVLNPRGTLNDTFTVPVGMSLSGKLARLAARRWQVEASVGAGAPMRVVQVREPARSWRADVVVWPALRVGPVAGGPLGGVSVRTYLDDQRVVGTIGVPMLGGGLQCAVPLPGGLAAVPHAAGTWDLRSTWIRADGVDLRQIDPADFRAKVGFVSQEPRLFNGTLRDNVLMGRAGIDTQTGCEVRAGIP